MSPAAQKLLDELMTLPPEDRERLADILYGSLQPENPAEIAAEWDAEIKRRLDQIDSGEVQLIDGDTVMKAARARLRR